jgi:hypothetical protein
MEVSMKLEAFRLTELEALPRKELQRIAREVGVYDKLPNEEIIQGITDVKEATKRINEMFIEFDEEWANLKEKKPRG